MKRRGNKSHKVPGVKLRPAQEGAVKLQDTREDPWEDDSQLASDVKPITDLCPRPFKGVVLCTTGIQDKIDLFKQAAELGAQTVNAFTDKVTHLVAADHGGAKYACAVQRKIPIMQESWITDSYHIWLKGDDVNITESIAEHRLPIFTGVVLCLSGADDLKREKDIGRLVARHGGQLLRNLERPVRVTHLLCSGDVETEKMRYAEKFNKSGEAQISLVWEEWFWDTLDSHGRFDEDTYQVRNPRPERKKILEDPPTSPPRSSSLTPTRPEQQRPSSAKESQTTTAPPPQGDDDEEEEVVANIKKIPAVTLHLWSSLLKVRGYEVQDGRLLLSPTKGKLAKELPRDDPTPSKPNGSILSTFCRVKSFVQPEAKDASLSTARQPFRRAATTQALTMRSTPISAQVNQILGAGGPSTQHTNTQVDQPDDHPSALFLGKRFRALGEAKSPSVRDAILRQGGVFVSDADVDDDIVDYIVVRLVSGSKLFRDEPDEALRPKYRTECWLERCIFEDRICEPEEHVTFLPLDVSLPIAGVDLVNLSLSGFDQSEGCWITRLLRALGINLAKSFSRHSTHLLCPSGTGVKFDKAKEWGVPVVGMDWLTAIARTGAVPALEDRYIVKSACGGAPRLLAGGENPSTSDAKGKGKAAEPWDPLRNKVSPKKRRTGQLPLASNIMNHNNIHDTQTQTMSIPIPPRTIPMQKTHSISSTTSSTSSSRTASPRARSPAKMVFGPPSDILTRSSLSRVSSTSSTSSYGQPLRTPTRNNNNSSSSSRRLFNTLSTSSTTHGTHIPRPSSRTPSPAKTPALGSGRARRLSTSPTKAVIDMVAARALQENITSMLGKRPLEEDVGTRTMGGRTGKRPRPQRSRGQLRDIPAPDFTTGGGGGGGGGLFEPIEDGPVCSLRDEGSSPFVAAAAAAEERNAGDDGVRVVYEDPGQMDERKRLMSLLKAHVEEDGLPLRQTREARGEELAQALDERRSARVAGF